MYPQRILLLPENFLRWSDFIGDGMLGQLREQTDFLVEYRAHTIGNVLLMCSVDCYTLFAVAVVAANFQTGAVVFVLVLNAKGRSKFFLNPQTFFPVSVRNCSIAAFSIGFPSIIMIMQAPFVIGIVSSYLLFILKNSRKSPII